MQIATLENTQLSEITETFNRAFQNYIVPLQLTPEQLKENIIRDNVQLNYSVGAFSQDKLVGIILQALGEWQGKPTAYNAGTGVIAKFRGKKLTQQLYNYILPYLKAAGIEQCMLEVITTNEPALKNYEALGFNVNRVFDCFRGSVKPIVKTVKEKIVIQDIKHLYPVVLTSLGTELPSWQNSLAGAERNKTNNRQLGIYLGDELVGYGIVQPVRGRVIQFAIAEAYRGQGLGHRLFWEMSRLSQTPLSIMNVDQAYAGTINFLKAVGLVQTISQFEMIKTL